MNNKKEIRQEIFKGERSLFTSSNLSIYDTIFEDGESPLKESSDIELFNSMFKWKYPLWYCNNVTVNNCTLFENARAGIWYSNNILFENSYIEAPKSFRRCNKLSLKNISFPNASETLWHCSDVVLENLTVKGDYFAMNCENICADKLSLYGNYSFDGVKNAVIRNSHLLTKDAFWNSENITVYDSFISGEYLGWNSKNLTLINCTVESLQGMCYIDNIVMKNCKLINTTLAFEYSNVDAEIIGAVDSVKNPNIGRIVCDSIGELILESDRIDTTKTKIICKEKAEIL